MTKSSFSIFSLLFPFLGFISCVGCASKEKAEVKDVLSHNSCSGPEIITLQMPILPSNSSGETFPYYLQIHRGKDPNAPFVVYLTGGPGYTEIGQNIPALTQDLNYILVDQRSSGCNSGNRQWTPEELTSENLAADVTNAIVTLGLDNYVLYGWSFGSLEATKVAAQLEQIKAKGAAIHLPKKLILDGVLGRAFNLAEALNAVNFSWDQVKAKLSPGVTAELHASTLPFSEKIPAGETPLRWGNYIWRNLYMGTWANDLAHQLATLDHGDTKLLSQGVTSSLANEYFPLFTNIICREIDENFFTNLALSKGLLMETERLCGQQKFTIRYDAATLKTTVPITYFSGSMDPATPPWQARYHFDHKLNSERTLITIPGGGHFSFAFTLGLCRQILWESLLSPSQDVKTALESCPGIAKVEEQFIDPKGRVLNLVWR